MSKSSTAKRLGATLPFQYFVRQRQVLTLYRHLLKSVKKNLDGNESLQKELQVQIRSDFRRNKEMKDNVAVASLIQEAKRNLEQIKDMNSGPADSHGGAGSWINTEDEDDKRGRIGNGWPWGGGG